MDSYALLAIDDQLVLEKLRDLGKEAKVNLEVARTADDVVRKMESKPPSIIFLDLNSKPHRPLTLIRRLKSVDTGGKAVHLVGFVAGNDALKHRAHALGCSFVYSRSELIKQAKSIMRSLMA